MEEWASDDLTGLPLDAHAVKTAREEEMEFMRKLGVFEERDTEECWRRIGKAPVSTKWVDCEKGGGVRSRWVARDFKPKGEKDRADLFAAMPPLEAKRLLFRMFTIESNRVGKRRQKLVFKD